MSKENNKLGIELDGIGHTISDNRLAVPIYQRSYAWEEKHVTELFNDLFFAISNRQEEYFIGSIVVSSGNNQKEVVDGQQRLATISILIAAIRDYFFENNEKERADEVQKSYLSSMDRRTLELIPKIKLNANDQDYYYKKIILYPGHDDKKVDSTRDSHERIKKAYGIAKGYIQNYTKHSHKPAELLLDLLDYIDSHLKIILVKVPDDTNAFTIFETLNDRGLDLAISDLLKNYLYGQSNDRLLEVQEKWTEMYSLLESNQKEELIVTFIRHYWSSIHGLTRERELYREIKKNITSKQRAIDMVTDLAKGSKIYISMIDLSQSFWDEYEDNSKQNMMMLNNFGMVQVRSLLLAIFSKFGKNDIEYSLEYLVNASVRFLIHGGLGSGALETQYSDRAKEINKGEINSFNELKDKLMRAIPTDAQFEESFSTATVSKLYLARYYLHVLEKVSRGVSNQDFISNNDTKAVNLEHILPKNPDVEWDIDEDSHKLLYSRIGNLALMNSRDNSNIGNLKYTDKLASYQDSNFQITRNIVAYSNVKWGKQEIDARQRDLARLAVTAWPIR